MDATLHQLGGILLRARQTPAWETGAWRSAVRLALLIGLVCSVSAQERPPPGEPARRAPTRSIRQVFMLRLGEPEAGDESAGVHKESNGPGSISQLSSWTPARHDFGQL